MTHRDSRYETQCPAHGWYFFEDGCAVTGCENAPANESGAVPETLREAPWASLNDVVTAYVSDVAPPGGDSPRAIVLAAIDRLRAALERPRPPERVHDDVTRSDHDGARASDVLGEAPERADTPSVAGDRTESEKERRVHYQDIVYGVLARLETLTGERNTQATREATIALLERALERPRPAPPEPEIAKRLRHLAISGTVGGDLMIRAAELLEGLR